MINEEFLKKIYDCKNITFTSVQHNKTVNSLIEIAFIENSRLYFLVDREDSFFEVLKAFPYVSINHNHGAQGFTINGSVKEINHDFIKTIFGSNKELAKQYRGKAGDAMAVMVLYSWNGSYVDTSKEEVERSDFLFEREAKKFNYGFFQINNTKCSQCGRCLSVCPQRCIDMDRIIIWPNNCIRCGACYLNCPLKCIENATEQE